MKKTTLIGINGKIGSGKDTVGSIIQYLTSESGNQNSSRHRTYEEFLSNGGGSVLRNFDQHYVSDWEIKKFAGKLKQIAYILTGFSIEMFEAVGERYWSTYFSKIKESLNNGGRALIQTITINDFDFEQYKKNSDYIRHYVFPGGLLPSKKVYPK